MEKKKEKEEKMKIDTARLKGRKGTLRGSGGTRRRKQG